MTRSTNGRILQIACGAILLASISTANTPDPDEVWSYTTGTEGIGKYAVSLGNGGSQVFSDAGFAYHRTRLFSALQPNTTAPTWETSIATPVFNQSVASATSTDLHFSLVQHRNSSNALKRDLVLRAWRSDNEQPIWTQVLSTTMSDEPNIWVACSADGSRVISVARDNPELVWVHDGETGVELNSYTLSLFSQASRMRVSRDGDLMVINNNIGRQVIDVMTGTVVHDAIDFDNTFDAIAMSASGSHFGVSADNRFDTYAQQADGSFTLSSGFTAGSSEHAMCGALSGEGLVAAAAFSISGGSQSRIVAWNTSTSAVLLDELYTGTGSARSWPTGLVISDDGKRLALSMTGDGTVGLAPEVAVFDAQVEGNAFALRSEYNVPGSVMSLAISSDGTRLATCGRTTHATYAQALKVYSLYRFDRDIYLEGVSQAGSTLTATITGEPGVSGFVVVATQAAPTPLLLPMGTLYLKRTAVLEVVPTGPIGADGKATATFTLPTGSASNTYYFQGYTSLPRALGEHWETVTVLP